MPLHKGNILYVVVGKVNTTYLHFYDCELSICFPATNSKYVKLDSSTIRRTLSISVANYLWLEVIIIIILIVIISSGNNNEYNGIAIIIIIMINSSSNSSCRTKG